MSLCKYKNYFGEPGKGVHSYRIFNIAIVDVVMTLIGALIISYLSGIKFKGVTADTTKSIDGYFHFMLIIRFVLQI